MRVLPLSAIPLALALLLGSGGAVAAIEPDNPCRDITSQAAQLQPPNTVEYRRLVAQTATPITDGHGYTLTAHDAWFFGMTAPQLANWRARKAPLTLSPTEFNEFTHELYAAAAADGLDGRLDIRLKGSSAGLWSNPMKAMPRNAEQAAEIYQAKEKKWPTKAWCQRVAKRFAEWLGPDRVGDKDAVPTYRPFNALSVLGVSDDKSDVDVQISSNQAAEKITAVCTADGITPCKAASYGFFRKTPTFKALPSIAALMNRWADTHQLDFTFAVFPGSGPDNYLSSFRPTDWIVSEPCTHTALNNTAPATPLDWQNPGLQSCPLANPIPSTPVPATSQTLPAPGDASWASQQSGNGLTGRALMEAVLRPETLARIAEVDAIVGSSRSTAQMFSDGKGNWTPSRDAIHNRILDKAWAAAASVPAERKVVYAGGLPGAGKTTYLSSDAAKKHGINLAEYLVINPDDMKALIVAEPGALPDYPGLRPAETAALVHQESSYLADELQARAMAVGKNILIDRTMGAAKPVLATMQDLKSAGYTLTSVYVDSTPTESLARSEFRYRGTNGDYSGRPIQFTGLANETMDAQGRTRNRIVFDTVAVPGSTAWILVDHHKLGAPVVAARG